MTKSARHQFTTDLVHAGFPEERPYGAVTFPIFQSSVFEYSGGGGPHGIRYIRYNNTPTQTVLAARIAAVQGGAAGLVTASGMAAVTATMLALHSQGDHVLALRALYGATHSFLNHDMPRFGVDCSYFSEAAAPAGIEALIQPNTKSIYVETITNPMLRVVDHAEITRIAKRHGLLSIIDNSFASPAVFKPLDCGYDIVIESCSKYIGGHTDLVAGSISGSEEVIEKILPFLNHHGGTLDPHAAFLVARGLTTLDVRVRRQCDNAMRLARWLEKQARVKSTWYPGLESHPDYATATRLFAGYSGMIAIELDGSDGDATQFLDALRLLTVAPSLGGPETLITRPALTSSSSVDEAERREQGITDTLFRISVGLEDPDDLISDLEQAFEKIT